MAIHAPITGALTGATPLPHPWVSIGDVHAGRSRAYVEDAIEALVGYLDSLDGDADTEDFDPDLEPDGTGHGDPAWIEWQTRGGRKLDVGGAERIVRLPLGGIAHEDVEDCDPAEDADADEDSHDREAVNEDGDAADAEAWRQPTVTAYAVAKDL